MTAFFLTLRLQVEAEILQLSGDSSDQTVGSNFIIK